MNPDVDLPITVREASEDGSPTHLFDEHQIVRFYVTPPNLTTGSGQTVRGSQAQAWVDVVLENGVLHVYGASGLTLTPTSGNAVDVALRDR